MKFGDTKEGTMGVRVPTVLDLKQTSAKKGGNIVNADGDRDGKTWGKQAPWVDYHGRWMAKWSASPCSIIPAASAIRPIGTSATTACLPPIPFGLHDFKEGRKEPEGEYMLPAGETLTLRYRFLFHKGDEAEAKIAEAFEAYSKEKPADAEAK